MLRTALPFQVSLRSLFLLVGILSTVGLYTFWGRLPTYRTTYPDQLSSTLTLASTSQSASASASTAIPKIPGEALSTSQGNVSCVGPRGKRISESPDDQVRFHKLNGNPHTFAGSYDALSLDSQWTTADGRYGPYGYKQDDDNPRQPVEWEKVDWGKLQAQCFRDNAHLFPEHGRKVFDAAEIRMRLRTKEDSTSSAGWLRNDEQAEKEAAGENPVVRGVPGEIRHRGPADGTKLFPTPEEVITQRTNRTLLVVRTYDDYKYTEEDKINLRALVSETALQAGGRYSVMLLVNVKDNDAKIFESEEAYWKAFKKTQIPAEFQGLAVLWDEQLLKSWYPKIEEHRIIFQINQAFQLLAVFYPEFEHFWQLEMDIRSLGHHLPLLDGLDQFSRAEPRKQSIERASYLHVPEEQGPYYPDFLSKVNESLRGGSNLWGPIYIPEVSNPVGPKPPVAQPEDEHFEWGRGDPADLIVTSVCSSVFRMRNWPFRDWIEGPFSMKGETVRIACPPATQRASRTLLLAIHAAQMDQGLAVPSEAILPTFALWHGLKISFPPMPYFQNKKNMLDDRTRSVFYNGGAPGECVRVAQPPPKSEKAAKQIADDVAEWLKNSANDPIAAEWVKNGSPPTTVPWKDKPWRSWYRGLACGEAFIDQWPRDEWTAGISWWWQSSFPRRVLDVWTGGGFAEGVASHDAEGEQHDIDEAYRQGNTAEWERLVEKKKWDEQHEVTTVLQKHDGEWYAPAGWWHPAKTKPK